MTYSKVVGLGISITNPDIKKAPDLCQSPQKPSCNTGSVVAFGITSLKELGSKISQLTVSQRWKTSSRRNKSMSTFI